MDMYDSESNLSGIRGISNENCFLVLLRVSKSSRAFLGLLFGCFEIILFLGSLLGASCRSSSNDICR